MQCAGAKINAIENLGATQNQFDSIDLSDNAIIILEGFPKLPRLKTLLLSNNRVTRIARKLEGAHALCCCGCPAQYGVLATPICSAKHPLTVALCVCRVHSQPPGPDVDEQPVEEPAGESSSLSCTNLKACCASIGPSEEWQAGVYQGLQSPDNCLVCAGPGCIGLAAKADAPEPA